MTPEIDPDEVAAFFADRARRIDEVGPTRAVIYQDKQGDLAERRDAAEIARVLPILRLDGRQALLDVGCGTGRWSRRLVPMVARYHGIDSTDGLLAHARAQHQDDPHCRFTHLHAEQLSVAALGEADFDRVLCAGICMYLNDAQLTTLFGAIGEVTTAGALVLLREPVAAESRLTLKGHFSAELEHDYHAIYRSVPEFMALLQPTLLQAGFALVGEGDVYAQDGLNNRAETRQRWFLLERA
ncbi:MAG: class I SAM-dependent methyltransferase [Stenotrophomonas sp.]|uniref:class I SAM-dependent methyltransferase n=1 Tax=Stenotrophomonas sp. TaxID=69392 RepID=UPI002FC8009D